MKIIVQSKTLKVTQALRTFVERQVAKIISRGQKITKVTVMLEKVARKKSDQDATAAKVCIKVPGKTLTVQRHAHDLYQAINEAVDRSDRVLRKMKEKRLSRRNRQDRNSVRPSLAFSGV